MNLHPVHTSRAAFLSPAPIRLLPAHFSDVGIPETTVDTS